MVAAAAAAAAASAAAGKPLSAPELPSLENWLASCNLILEALISVKQKSPDENDTMKNLTLTKTAVVAQDEGISGITNNAQEAAVSWLESSKGLNMKFSMSRCQRALPAAKEFYLKELPPCYPTALHREQLEKALNAFHRMVKGPAVQVFAKRLEEECISIWESGRQLCDAISLTGKPCMHQRHHVKAGGSQTETNSEKHSSGFVFLHACACGRSRRLRDDPFDFDSANVKFSCFPNCEGLLPSLVLPGESKMGPLHASSWNLIRVGRAGYYDPSKGLLQSGFFSNENLLLKWAISLGQHKGIGIDTMHNIPITSSSQDSKLVSIAAEEVHEAGTQHGTSENYQRKAPQNIPSESTISFGKGLPSFVMKKAFSEVVAGTSVLDSKFSLLQQKKQPKVPPEKDVRHTTTKDITNDQGHLANGCQEIRKTGQFSVRQGAQTSFQTNGDPFLQIGSNVVPVNVDYDKKTKPKGSLKKVNIYVGFEHECPHGHRFLLSTEHLKELGSSYSLFESSHCLHAEDSNGKLAEKSTELNIMKEGLRKKAHIHSGGKITAVGNTRKKNKLTEVMSTSNQHYLEKENNQPGCMENLEENYFPVRLDDGSSAFSLLNRNLPVYMNCPYCMRSMEKDQKKFKFASTISQLQRIFLVTPPFPFVLTTCPVIQFEDLCLPPSVLDREQQSQFSPGCPIILPPESFITFRLPFIYGVQLNDGSLEPLHHLEHQPELTAWLAKGTSLQIMSNEFNSIDDFSME
uniref:Nonsense-mediated mRNA decay factor SMG8 n=1 Tax=Anthurium amnicola TaxID=1678845 RepID=A0A1D1YKM6_9ARAE